LPFTYVSHQAPAVGLKMLRPRWFDGTALVIGSMAPDFAYALTGSRFEINAHTWQGVIVFCLPVTLVMCWVIRARVAWAAFAQLPNTPLRLQDYRVLARRRPSILVTVMSAAVGAATHCIWDTFTHNGRWGVRHVHVLQTPLLFDNGAHFTTARLLQYVSHIVGALITIWLMWLIARRGLLGKWYAEAYTSLPPVELSMAERLWFWTLVATGFVLGALFTLGGDNVYTTDIIRMSLGLAAGVVVASCVPVHRRKDADVRAV
jgi:hypothetical protein